MCSVKKLTERPDTDNRYGGMPLIVCLSHRDGSPLLWSLHHHALTSLVRTGAAILICVCGQAQLIQPKRQQRHD